MINKLTVRGRMYLILAMTLFMFIVNAQFAWMNLNKTKDVGLENARAILLESQRQKIKLAADSAAAMLGKVLAANEEKGTEKELLQKLVNSFRFEADQSGYFFIYDGTVNVALPPKPEAQGKDLGQTKDPNGVYLVQELNRLAREAEVSLNISGPNREKAMCPKWDMPP